MATLQDLYNRSQNALYSKISPFTNTTGILPFGPKQPYVYTPINSGRRGINGLKRFESRGFPFASAIQDTVRIAKFMVSGPGIIFLTKQFILQRNQSFTETRIYNPFSPLLAVSSKINPFSDRYPRRFFKSILNFAPSGTVGGSALPSQNSGGPPDGGNRGLIRAPTAAAGYARLTSVPRAKNGGLLDGLKSLAKSIFGNFGPLKQPGRNPWKRADEGGYGIQLESSRFNYFDKNGALVKWGEDYFMRFEAGLNSKSKIKQYGETSAIGDRSTKGFIKIFGQTVPLESKYSDEEVGYSYKEVDGYTRYGDNLGSARANAEGSPYKFSDILSIYKIYVGKNTGYNSGQPTPNINAESKFTDRESKSVKSVIANLQKVIDGINRAGYKFSPLNDYDKNVAQFSNPSNMGLNHIENNTRNLNRPGLTPENYAGSYSADLRDSKGHLERIKGFSGTHKKDLVNSLTILTKKSPANSSELEGEDIDGQTQIYRPYEHDQIAFYFHDLVNGKYIPFRATVKGLNEQATANWSDINYIGRADKLANYTGFTRAMSFNFNVVAMSVKELLPMWKRINYLAGLVKPSRYSTAPPAKQSTGKFGTNPTTGEMVAELYYTSNDPRANNFMIPPLVSITIGDLYKEQPVILKSVGISIPDDALWETTSEAAKGDWKYLNSKIIYEGSGDGDGRGFTAQFPRECSIAISCDILEQERPRVGKNNFGGVDYEIGESIISAGKFSMNLRS